MQDLTLPASHHYWKNYIDPMIYRVVCLMESIENNESDTNPLFKIILNELENALNNLGEVNINQLEHRNAFITIANHLNMTQALRLLQKLDTVQAGSAAQLLGHAETLTNEPTDEAGIFLQRHLTFERLRLLARIFSEARLKLVREALESQSD